MYHCDGLYINFLKMWSCFWVGRGGLTSVFRLIENILPYELQARLKQEGMCNRRECYSQNILFFLELVFWM